MKLLTGLAALATLVLPALSPAVAVADAPPAPLPVVWDVGDAFVPGLFPETPPPGANDPNCRLTPQHPRPVILINGTASNQALAFRAGSPYLRNQGYCTYTFNYGTPTWIPEIPLQGMADIPASAGVLQATVDRVLAQTGAQKVDLVGWSQGGGIMPLYYINVLGGAAKVDKMIGISPSNHGTTLSNLVFGRSLIPPLGRAIYDLVGLAGPGLTQQAIDSGVANQVYGQGDTRPGVSYTTIVTRYDEVVTPYDQQFLNGPNVHNILVQDGCALDRSEHLSGIYSPRAWHFVANALDPAHATPVPCIPVDPFFPNVK